MELKTQRDVEVWNAAIDAVGEHVTGDWIKSFKRPDIVGKRIPCPKPIYKEYNAAIEAAELALHERLLKLTVGKSDYSTELDKVIEDEMKHKPKDIMK